MATIGRKNTLKVVRDAPPGFYLDGQELGEILLPRRYLPPKLKPGDELGVFVYLDSEDRLVATTETPRAMVGCARARLKLGSHFTIAAMEQEQPKLLAGLTVEFADDQRIKQTLPHSA